MGLNFSLFSSLADNFTCFRCKHKEGVTQFFIFKGSENACVSCKNCGYTDIYEYHILDDKFSLLK